MSRDTAGRTRIRFRGDFARAVPYMTGNRPPGILRARGAPRPCRMRRRQLGGGSVTLRLCEAFDIPEDEGALGFVVKIWR